MATHEETVDNEEIVEYRSAEHSPDPADPGEGDVEEQARALGWKPEDEFEGNPGKWTDAEAFLELHSKNNGALRKALAAQTKKTEELERRLNGLDAAHQKIFKLQIDKLKEEHTNQLAFLKAQKREALRAGEHDTAADIDEQIDTLRERGPEIPDVPQAPTAKKPDDWRSNTTLAAWADRNSWFDKDKELTAFAGGTGQALRANNPDMPFDDLLEEVTRLTRKAFPEKFQAARRSPVEETTTGATRAATGARTYASLPKEAKAVCDEAVSEGGITQKQWVELYYGYDDRRKR